MTPVQFSKLKKSSLEFRTDSPELRRERIRKLRNWISSNEALIIEALKQDFKKPEFESQISEIMPSLTEANFALKNLKRWMKDKRVATPLSLLGYRSRIRYENKGVVLIISPWNYPFQLAVVPLIAALAAGNSAVIKPSELTPYTSQLILKMVTQCFDSAAVSVELGDKDKTTELLSYDFDHVFFTGSTPVGRIISKACAERMIPLTLELGGKSPTIVDETCNLEEAVDKIFWGKFLNRAQTCVAPDYILAHKSIAKKLTSGLKLLAAQSSQFDKGRIINESHKQRLQNLTQNKTDLDLVSLEVVSVDSPTHPLMREEIFGPVLPIVEYRNLSDLDQYLLGHDKPLSLYIFSKNQKTIDFILKRYSSGGAGINAVLVQFGNHHLPFGGVGASGRGNYHGHFGFLEMSHSRGIIEQSFLSGLRNLLMPPYTPNKIKFLNLIKKF